MEEKVEENQLIMTHLEEEISKYKATIHDLKE